MRFHSPPASYARHTRSLAPAHPRAGFMNRGRRFSVSQLTLIDARRLLTRQVLPRDPKGPPPRHVRIEQVHFGPHPGRLGLLPRILPDELVYSVLGRYCSMMQVSTYRLLDSAFASVGRRRISILYTSRLSALAGRLPPGSPNAEQLVARSSLHPYLGHFLTAADRERLRLHLLHGATFSVQGIGRLMSRLPGAPHTLAFCPDCVKEDVASVGRAGWRRMHQMPLVFRCPWHDAPLRTERTVVGSWPDFVTCPVDAHTGVELKSPLGRHDAAAVARLTLDILDGNAAGLATLDDVACAYGK